MSKKSLTIRTSAEIYPENRSWDVRHYALVWLGRIQTWRRNAQTRKQLAGLPAWLYPDIGLTEQQIRHEIHKKFWQ